MADRTPENIYLIGYMASGKTTLGRAAAQAWGRPFADLDEEVERMAGESVASLFARCGEAAFRRLEAEALRRVSATPGAIVACGGGTPCHGANMELMQATGVTVWLDADTASISRRVAEAPGQRPLLDGLGPEELERRIAAHLAARRECYARAAHRLDSSRLETGEEVARAVAALGRLLSD